jgi:hypothetical protein
MDLMTFLIVLIITAGNGQVNAGQLPPYIGATPCDTDIPSPTLPQEKSLLAVIAPLFEPNSWPLNLTTKMPDANIDANALPKALAENTKKGRTISALAIHALCADVLSTYVDKNGLVDYKMLRRKRLALISVLGEYANLDPNSYAAWSDTDKLAFWINAHNMCIIKAVIDNYPIQPSRFKVIFYPPNSVMQISDFWEKVDYTIMGEKYSIEEIENKVLRTQFVEPRLCFALSYASLGCAPLRREPYYGRNLSEQLGDQAKLFLASETGMKIDREGRVVYLTPIVQWYENEFLLKYPPAEAFKDKKTTEAAILTYISRHISQKDADWLLRKIFTIQYLRYNWTLNEQP